MTIDVTLTSDGRPALKIRHFDKSDALTEITLGMLLTKGKERGLKVVHISGFVEIGKPETAHENYYIVANDEI